jgi:hypothetical protein
MDMAWLIVGMLIAVLVLAAVRLAAWYLARHDKGNRD